MSVESVPNKPQLVSGSKNIIQWLLELKDHIHCSFQYGSFLWRRQSGSDLSIFFLL